MDISNTVRLGIAVVIVGGGAAAYWHYHQKREVEAARERLERIRRQEKLQEDKDLQRINECVSPVISEGQMVSKALADAMGYARQFVDDQSPIDLKPSYQNYVFEQALRLAINGNTEDLEKTVKNVIRNTLPDCDWDKAPFPAPRDTDLDLLYRGVQTLVELAELEMRYGTWRTMPPDHMIRVSGVVCPGWVHRAPAPTATVKPDDYIEIVIAAESDDGTSDVEESVWARVTRVEGDSIHAILRPDEILPGGAVSPSLRYSNAHGYQANDTLVIPRHCVFRLLKRLEP